MRQLLVFTGLALAASAANAVSFINGSFESGINPGYSTPLRSGDSTSITGWKVASGTVDLVGTAWDAADGSHSIDLSGTGPGSIVQTLHGLTVGTRYVINFDLSGSYNSVRTSANMASVSIDGSPTQTYSYNLNNTTHDMMYQPESYLFTATNAIGVVHFSGLDKSNYGAVLDNVSIGLAPTLLSFNGAVPEPAVWAMMIGGFGLTGVSMRRRNKAVAA